MKLFNNPLVIAAILAWLFMRGQKEPAKAPFLSEEVKAAIAAAATKAIADKILGLQEQLAKLRRDMDSVHPKAF